MRADHLLHRWRGLLLACAVLTSGCASLPPPPGRGANLRYTPPVATTPVVAEQPRALASSRPSPPEPEEPQRLRIVDASGEPGEVTARLLAEIADLLP